MNIPTIRHERMSDIFQKFHIDGLPFPAVIHEFTEPDTGDPHDHPFDFTTHILSGGYVEEVWRKGYHGGWWPEIFIRSAGTSHIVKATDIHQIIALPNGPCHTLMIPGPVVRKSGFWRFNNGQAQFREWDQPEFITSTRKSE